MSNFSIMRRLASVALLSVSALVWNQAHAQDVPPHVLLKTSMGDIEIELNPEKAPLTVANFLKYVKKGQYKGTLFHRVIDGFMIQGGGYDAKYHEKPTLAPIKNEANNGLKNEPYTIAMARSEKPHSAAAQFFINVNNNTALDFPSRDGWGYCVFGRVVEGKEVVDQIRKVETGNISPMFQDVPKKQVVILDAKLVTPAPQSKPEQ